MMLMQGKANKKDLDHIEKIKTNKIDFENQMKAIDILHQ